VSRKPHGRTFPNFLCILPVAIAQSSSDGVAICYILPFFVDDAIFSKSGFCGALCVFLSAESVRVENTTSIPTKFSSMIRIIFGRALGGGKVCYLR